MYFEKVKSRLVLLDLRSGKGFAEDYYLDAKSQCAGKRGACPDRCGPINGVSSDNFSWSIWMSLSILEENQVFFPVILFGSNLFTVNLAK